MDYRGAESGAVPPVALIDPLDHLLAALMLEIHVDIGRLVARLGDKPLEHHRADFGADRGHAKAIADHRIGRRPAPLTQNAARPGKGHHIIHGQKIGLVAQFGDEGQLMLEHPAHPVRGTVRIAPIKTLKGKTAQPLAGGFAIAPLARIVIAQRIQRKAEPRGEVGGALHRRLVPPVEVTHFGLRAQALLGVAQSMATEGINRHPKADRAQHISQTAAVTAMHERGSSGDGRQTQPRRQLCQPVKPRRITPVIVWAEHEMQAIRKPCHQRTHL